MKFFKNPVLYIVTAIFLFVGGVYWAFEYKRKKALAKPDDVAILQTWELSERLMELSGISYLGNQKMACVQDEEAVVFLYDLKAKKVLREIAFGDPDDYESVAVVGDTAYVLKSDGTIFEMKIPSGNQTEATAVKYAIPKFDDFDMESLGHDKQNKRLLLVPKTNPQETEMRKVYAFDLATKKLNPDPLFEIDLKGKIREFDYGNEVFKDEETIKIEPADIAVHPISGLIYIIDAENHMILEFSPNGKPKAVYRLNAYIFKNPEGICFNPEGEMYISSEGSIGAFANIWRIELEEPFQEF
jgi:uncharacterized protein YjiK